MTRPIRNTGPCFPSGLPRQRGQRDVLSHTEFYTPIFCMLSVFQAIPFELPRKPPTVNKWDSTLGTPGRGQVLQSISSPNVKCAPETTARWQSHSGVYGKDFHEMHAHLYGSKSLFTLYQIMNETRFPFLSR